MHSNSVFLANPATGAPAPSETTKYDLDGRVIATSDFEGRQTTYTYSWNGAAQTGNLGTYGAWTKTTDSGIKRVDNSAVTSWESVDYYGHSLQRSDFGGKVTTTAYNRAGYLVQEYGSTYDVTDYSYLNTGRYLLISSKLILEEKDWVGALGSPSGYLQVNQKRRQIDTQFKYDKVGNRTFERAVITYFGEGNGFVADKEIRADRQIALPTAGGPAWTSDLTFIDRAANISYDSWNRMNTYTDTGLFNAVSNTYDQLVMTSYQYDANSNVKSVSATYKNLAIGASGTLTTEYWHSYDDMNRFLVNGGVKSGSTILIAANQGGSFTYNKAGWRISSTKGAGTALQLEQYDYDALGNISAIKLKTGTFAVPPVLRGSYGRDALGRVTSYTEFGSSGAPVYRRYNIQYDMTNQILSELTYQQSNSTYETLNTVYDYSLNTNGTLLQNGLRQTYVAGQYQGVLTHIITRKGDVVGEGANATETGYFYNWGEQALRYHAGILTGPGTGPGSSLTVNYDDLEYDSRGNLTGVEFDISNASTRYRSDFINTFDGKVMARYTSKNESVAPSNLALEYSYYGNDRLVGMNGNDGAPEKDYSTAIQTRYAAPSTTAFRTGYSAYADFNQSYEPVSLNSDRGASTAYAVQDGDSLAGIALAIWGDASLWYLLADANGMSADSSLAVGSTLWVPAGVHNVHNSSTTFKPYDPNLSHSNTEPIVAGPQAGKKKKKCGALGQILVIAVSVAVTAILTPVLGPWAPVAGNLAGQGVGLVTGVQSKFNFKSLATTAITAGIDASGATKFGPLLGSNALGDIASGVASSTLSQGVAIAAGLQSRFSWTSVAAAGVEAGVGGAVSRSLPNSGGAVDPATGRWVRSNDLKLSAVNRSLSGVAGSLAGAAATSLVTGSNFGDTIVAQLPSILRFTAANFAAEEVASWGAPEADTPVHASSAGFSDKGDGFYINREAIASAFDRVSQASLAATIASGGEPFQLVSGAEYDAVRRSAGASQVANASTMSSGEPILILHGQYAGQISRTSSLTWREGAYFDVGGFGYQRNNGNGTSSFVRLFSIEDLANDNSMELTRSVIGPLDTFLSVSSIARGRGSAGDYITAVTSGAGALASVGGAVFRAAKGARAAERTAVIGRMDDLTAPGALRPGEYTIADKLPDLGSPKANYYNNMSVLREEMRRGVPIRDASAAKPDNFPVPTALNPGRTVRQTFTGAERNQLRNRGWTFDGQYWNPPK